MTDPDNLEGPGPTPEERAANHRALMKLHPGNRFRLMFSQPLLPQPDYDRALEKNLEDHSRDPDQPGVHD